jgi:prepilin-type N-terminal cleavage/methylation domain-containing protein
MRKLSILKGMTTLPAASVMLLAILHSVTVLNGDGYGRFDREFIDQMSGARFPIKRKADIRHGLQGFTLLELMATLTLVAIVLSFGVPSFLPQMVEHQSREGALSVFSWLKTCRSQAVTSARTVICTVDFTGDNVVTALDIDIDGVGGDETLYSNTIGIGAFTDRSTDSLNVEFDALGFADSASCITVSGSQGSFTSSSKYKISVATSGIVRIEEDPNAAC